MTGYLKVAHSCKSAAALARAKSKFVPKPLKDLYSDGLSFDLHILQNANDGIYRRNQFEPFARSLSNDSRFFLDYMMALRDTRLSTELCFEHTLSR